MLESINLPELKSSDDRRKLLHTLCKEIAEEKNVSVWEIRSKKQLPKLVTCRVLLSRKAKQYNHIKNKHIADFLNKDVSTITGYTNKYKYRSLL